MDKTQSETTQQLVRAITPGTTVRTVLMVAEASRKEARNGPFWMLDLKDATGTLPARIWSPLSLHFEDIPTGSLVEVEGRAERYREQTQLSVSALRVLPPEEVAAIDTSAFMPSTARSPLLMLEELEALADDVLTHAPWHRFVRGFLHDEDVRPRIIKAPAARGIHHARAGGLLEHTLGVTRLCLHFAELYPQLDRQALFVGAVCHDLGKLWELTLDFNTDYTDEGRLAGHIFLGLEKMRPHLKAAGLAPDLVLHLQHLILSHHGEYEFGSPRLPQTSEALALHYADNMDAKMDQCRNLFTDMAPEEGVWAPFQKSLGRPVYRAPRTPSGADGEETVTEAAVEPMPEEAIAPEPLEPWDTPTVAPTVTPAATPAATPAVAPESAVSSEIPVDGPAEISGDPQEDDLFGPPGDDCDDEPPLQAYDDVPPRTSEDECVFEHVTNAAYIEDVVAVARAEVRPETSADEAEAFFFLSGTEDTPARFAFEALPESLAEAPVGAIADPFADLPEPTTLEPIKPEPVELEPVHPEPAHLEPVQPEPVKPEPVQPEPVKPESAILRPVLPQRDTEPMPEAGAEAESDTSAESRAEKARQEKRLEARQCSLL